MAEVKDFFGVVEVLKIKKEEFIAIEPYGKSKHKFSFIRLGKPEKPGNYIEIITTESYVVLKTVSEGLPSAYDENGQLIDN